MGEALLGGLLDAGWATPDEVRVVEALAPRRDELSERYPGVEVTDVVGPAEGTVLATKPGDIPAACAGLGPDAGRVLSIAAGVRLASLEAALPDGTPVVRAMPNTPALVGAGAAAIAGGTSADDDDLAWAEQILSAVGIVVRVSEASLDAVTGLSGSGPAYIFLILEALADAGVKVGLSRRNAQKLAAQTVMGSAKLLLDTDEHPGRLKDMVTSPGGTAIAGLHTLEEGGLRTTLINAVETATKRARELGRGNKG
jgi:pyrroline-5-carboxylate reductase